MHMHLHIGDFILEIEGASTPLEIQFVTRLATPWFDYGHKSGVDRRKSVAVCVVCGEMKSTCECEEPMFMSAADVADSLTSMHQNMVEHLMGESPEETE